MKTQSISPKVSLRGSVVAGYVLPGLPQPLLTPDAHPGYRELRQAFERVRAEIAASEADLIVIYSTMWPSVIGHQIQARPEPEWIHVDEEFHDLGSIPYKFKMDAEFAKTYAQIAREKGLHARTVDYHGFPIDTGSVVALKLINPDNRLPATIVSSNVYSDRAETFVLGRAAGEAVERSGRKAVAVIVSTLSNRLHANFIDAKADKIHSLKDEEWNQKILEFLAQGRLEDIAQLSRQIHREARVKKVGNFKPFWWLSSFMGSGNCYQGEILAYQPVYGTGSAVISLQPARQAARDLEFDEDSPDRYEGERNVLAPSGESATEFSAQSAMTHPMSSAQQSWSASLAQDAGDEHE